MIINAFQCFHMVIIKKSIILGNIKVPHLFIQSQLVRNSIFALASMVLQSTITPAFNDSLQIAQIQNNLFNSTLEYFLDVLNQTKSIINGCPETIDFQNVTTAKN